MEMPVQSLTDCYSMARSRWYGFDGLGINSFRFFHDPMGRNVYNFVITLLNKQAMTSQSLFLLCPIAQSLLDQTVPWKTANLSRMRQLPAKGGELGTGHRAK